MSSHISLSEKTLLATETIATDRLSITFRASVAFTGLHVESEMNHRIEAWILTRSFHQLPKVVFCDMGRAKEPRILLQHVATLHDGLLQFTEAIRTGLSKHQ
jgi:hypothetical protein